MGNITGCQAICKNSGKMCDVCMAQADYSMSINGSCLRNGQIHIPTNGHEDS